ncbi:MAG: 50S ribosomal protein L6 [Clostridiales Family XIII bacterium]|jgi:large subunit ribosomal protein L6|nr:50S ribosomal protein L6 [Clostridiales Family XIII bacterium]
MSRIGKESIKIIGGVEVNIAPDNTVTVKGKGGELKKTLPLEVSIKKDDEEIIVNRKNDTKEARSFHGLSRTLINNMIIGVTEGFSKKLEIIGVGYRAEKKGKKLILGLGYSHPVELEDPDGLTTEVPSQTEIIIRGIDKERVGNYAAIIRAKKPPEPYKGKGIRYEGEYIKKKEGKSGVKGD